MEKREEKFSIFQWNDKTQMWLLTVGLGIALVLILILLVWQLMQPGAW